MRVFSLSYENYNWIVELALRPPWDWHPKLATWLDNRDHTGKRTYMSWVDLDSRMVYIAFNTEREARSFATYAALLGIER